MSERAGIPESGAERRIAIRSPQNLAAGLALIAIAAIALWASADLAQGRFYSVGPRHQADPGALPGDRPRAERSGGEDRSTTCATRS